MVCLFGVIYLGLWTVCVFCVCVWAPPERVRYKGNALVNMRLLLAERNDT